MLRGISPLLSPKLLETLYRMGHHDEIFLGMHIFPEKVVMKILFERMD
jgi:L-fucose mutarotase/ribose pyranase (RbsD/FucU family)